MHGTEVAKAHAFSSPKALHITIEIDVFYGILCPEPTHLYME